LPGTGLEASRIASLFRAARPRGKALSLDGKQADKRRLIEALTRAPGRKPWRHLHLATHGFFHQVTREEANRPGVKSAYRRNPLLLAGLLLSGANEDADRGRITAEEVCELPLAGTDLVVLSACQTALGQFTYGEGVLGLQHAFHLAGARTVVTSLWSVS